MDNNEVAGQGSGGAPLDNGASLYKKLEPLSPERHRHLGLSRMAAPVFLHKAHMMPLTAPEFAAAASEHAIIFLGEQKMTAAIAGTVVGKSELVDENGAMKPETYLPAFVRRYPFTLVADGRRQNNEEENARNMMLCIDSEAPMLSDNPDFPFFDDDGNISDFVKDRMKFCHEFEQRLAMTRAMIQKFDELGLFEKKEETFKTVSASGGEPKNVKIAEYWAISGAAVDELSDENYLELRKMGAIGLIYTHLLSLRNWPHLMRRRSDRIEAESRRTESP